MKLADLSMYQEILDDKIEDRKWRSDAEAKMIGFSIIAVSSITYKGNEHGTTCVDIWT